MPSFKKGDKVIVFGEITDLTRYGWAVVKTDFGNSIVETLDSLAFASSSRVPEPIKDAVRLEKLARCMCRAAGYDPDSRATSHMPAALANGFVFAKETIPAWGLFAGNARAIIDAGLA